mmetsp:Transcript_15229/g.49699  ORF Transcript_15229/g.49699 Transcript_15229/m.49699 type:complete len:204 (+) Transcript_15229:1260-1871(+)
MAGSSRSNSMPGSPVGALPTGISTALLRPSASAFLADSSASCVRESSTRRRSWTRLQSRISSACSSSLARSVPRTNLVSESAGRLPVGRPLPAARLTSVPPPFLAPLAVSGRVGATTPCAAAEPPNQRARLAPLDGPDPSAATATAAPTPARSTRGARWPQASLKCAAWPQFMADHADGACHHTMVVLGATASKPHKSSSTSP